MPSIFSPREKRRGSRGHGEFGPTRGRKRNSSRFYRNERNQPITNNTRLSRYQPQITRNNGKGTRNKEGVHATYNSGNNPWGGKRHVSRRRARGLRRRKFKGIFSSYANLCSNPKIRFLTRGNNRKFRGRCSTHCFRTTQDQSTTTTSRRRCRRCSLKGVKPYFGIMEGGSHNKQGEHQNGGHFRRYKENMRSTFRRWVWESGSDNNNCSKGVSFGFHVFPGGASTPFPYDRVSTRVNTKGGRGGCSKRFREHATVGDSTFVLYKRASNNSNKGNIVCHIRGIRTRRYMGRYNEGDGGRMRYGGDFHRFFSPKGNAKKVEPHTFHVGRTNTSFSNLQRRHRGSSSSSRTTRPINRKTRRGGTFQRGNWVKGGNNTNTYRT